MHRCPLAAQIARIIALMALAALGLSGGSFHETFHARGPYVLTLATVRNLALGSVSVSVIGLVS